MKDTEAIGRVRAGWRRRTLQRGDWLENCPRSENLRASLAPLQTPLPTDWVRVLEMSAKYNVFFSSAVHASHFVKWPGFLP